MASNSLVGAYVYPTQGAGVARPHAATAAGGIALTYDAAGNLVTRNGGSNGRSYTLGWSADFLVGASDSAVAEPAGSAGQTRRHDGGSAGLQLRLRGRLFGRRFRLRCRGAGRKRSLPA
jgi:hypothetical protein